jgi:hypothetical protein
LEKSLQNDFIIKRGVYNPANEVLGINKSRFALSVISNEFSEKRPLPTPKVKPQLTGDYFDQPAFNGPKSYGEKAAETCKARYTRLMALQAATMKPCFQSDHACLIYLKRLSQHSDAGNISGVAIEEFFLNSLLEDASLWRDFSSVERQIFERKLSMLLRARLDRLGDDFEQVPHPRVGLLALGLTDGLWHGGGSERRNSESGGGGGGNIVSAIVGLTLRRNFLIRSIFTSKARCHAKRLASARKRH